MSSFSFLQLGVAGWVGRVPPGIKEFFNPSFLVLNLQGQASGDPREYNIMRNLKLYEFHECNINYVNDLIVSIIEHTSLNKLSKYF